jgi:hypothetical protein
MKALKKLTFILLILRLTFGGCLSIAPEDAGVISELNQQVTGIPAVDNNVKPLAGAVSTEYVYVTLNLNNGSIERSYQVKKGSTFAQPETPSYGENIFLGWFSGGKQYDFSAPVTQDITIQALWEKVYTSDLYVAMGAPTAISNGFASSNGANILVNTSQRFDRGSIEVTVSSSLPSDSGIIFCVENNGASSFWEHNVSYYFFFVSIEGHAYLGKVNNGKWSALKTLPIANFSQGDSYTIKVILNGTDIYCYVNGELYFGYSEIRFLTGGGFGLRTGTGSVAFTDFKVNGKVTNE